MQGNDVDDAMILRFWGVRGTLPTPGRDTVRYGGNTSCVEVRYGGNRLILDAGSGIRELGNHLATGGAPLDADILLSHTHLDHICGLPTFPPLFDPRAKLRFWGGHTAYLREALDRSWQAPLMPDLGKAFRASIAVRQFTPGNDLSLRAGLTVGTFALNHPGGAVGYRVRWGGASICYVTDTEHPADGLDRRLAEFVAGTELLIYDANDTDDEHAARIGWGHSTWSAGVRLAKAAGVGRLVLFHHDPAHDDRTMDSIAREAAASRPGTKAAREGMTIEITAGKTKVR